MVNESPATLGTDSCEFWSMFTPDQLNAFSRGTATTQAADTWAAHSSPRSSSPMSSLPQTYEEKPHVACPSPRSSSCQLWEWPAPSSEEQQSCEQPAPSEEQQPQEQPAHDWGATDAPSPPPSEEQQWCEQPILIRGRASLWAAHSHSRSISHLSSPPSFQGAAATRADHTHLRSGSPAQSTLVRGEAHTCSLHLSEEQQLGKRPAPTRGATDTHAAFSPMKRSSYASSQPPSEKQQPQQQTAHVRGVAGTRAAHSSPRSSSRPSRSSRPRLSVEWQPCAAYTGGRRAAKSSRHLTNEQQLGEHPSPIQGAEDTRAANPHWGAAPHKQPTPHLRSNSWASSLQPSEEQ